MRVAITGGTGYIGGRLLARALDSGWSVCAVVHPDDPAPLPQAVRRIPDPGTASELARHFDDEGVQVALHLAAAQDLTDGPDASDALVEANIAFGARVLSAAHASAADGVVVAGTFSTHALGGPEYVPQTLYAATKQALRDVATYYNRSTALTVVTLELSDNYGPGDERPKFLKLLRGAAASGEVLDATPGRQVIRPLHEFGPPEADLVGPMPYTTFQSMLDDPPGFRNYWTADYLDELSDAAIDTIADQAQTLPLGPSQLFLVPWGGAIARVGEDETPLTHREAAWVVHPLALWEDPAQDARHIGWCRDFRTAMGPFKSGGVYLNFIGDEGQDRIVAAYGPQKYARLAELKARYDPDNVFHLNQNIRPARTADAPA